jgi:hypothetical protein
VLGGHSLCIGWLAIFVDWETKLDEPYRRDIRRPRIAAWIWFGASVAIGVLGLGLIPWPSDHGLLIVWIGVTTGSMAASLRIAFRTSEGEFETDPLPPGPSKVKD